MYAFDKSNARSTSDLEVVTFGDTFLMESGVAF